jgi:DNA-binding CsgD family transcriptional regulator
VAERDRAVQSLETAFELFGAHDASVDAHRVSRHLRALGVHRRLVRRRPQTGWDSLTDSELRVLEVIAEGATNREAAEKLSVSPHTINAQLRSVFAKLDVHSRVELTRITRER